jgi:hypothetical protein
MPDEMTFMMPAITRIRSLQDDLETYYQSVGRAQAAIRGWASEWAMETSYFSDRFLNRLTFPITITFPETIHRLTDEIIVLESFWDLFGLSTVIRRIYDFDEESRGKYWFQTTEGRVFMDIETDLDVSEMASMLRQFSRVNNGAKTRAKLNFKQKYPAVTLL